LVHDAGGWRQQYADQPLRLTLTCYRRGHEPWTVPIDVDVDRVAAAAAAVERPVSHRPRCDGHGVLYTGLPCAAALPSRTAG
jgi:hypothetical protein